MVWRRRRRWRRRKGWYPAYHAMCSVASKKTSRPIQRWMVMVLSKGSPSSHAHSPLREAGMTTKRPLADARNPRDEAYL